MSLFVDLDTNTVWHGAKTVKVTAQQAEFLWFLVKNAGRAVKYQAIFDAVRPLNSENITTAPGDWCKVYATAARKVFKELGVDATLTPIWPRRGQKFFDGGYRLIFGETDPDAEFIARCLKHRDQIEAFLDGHYNLRRASDRDRKLAAGR